MKLFISYARTDRARMEDVFSILRKAGHDPWFDEQIVGGQGWKKRLFREILTCDAFIYTMTKASLASEYCTWEYNTARRLRKPIVPVLLEKCTLPDHVATLHYADFSTPAAASTTGPADLLGGLAWIARRRVLRIASMIATIIAVIIAIAVITTLVLPQDTRDDWLSTIGLRDADSEPVIAAAKEGETLLVLAPYAGDLEDVSVYPERYVRDALEQRVERLGDLSPRLENWPTAFTSQREARTAGEDTRSTLVIWGEFDDIGGMRTYIEIIPTLPQPEIQQGGDWLALAQPEPDQQVRVSEGMRECFLEALPQQADYLVLLSLGVIDMSAARLDSAVDLFTQAIDLSPTVEACEWSPVQAYYWRASVYTLQERYPDALFDLNQAVALDDTFVEARELRGSVLLALGKPALAEADFTAAQELRDPHETYAQAALLSNIGVARDLASDAEGALQAFEQAAALYAQVDTPDAEALNLIRTGNLYLREQDIDTAQAYYEDALTADRAAEFWQGEASALENLGLIALAQQDVAQARDSFDRAAEIYRDHDAAIASTRILVRFGMADLDTEDYAAAQQHFNAAFDAAEQAGSRYYQAWSKLGLGLLAHAQNQPDAAREAWEDALTLMEEIGSPDAQIIRQVLETY